MSYHNYISHFNSYSTTEGYYQACRLLAFNSNWDEIAEYRCLLEKTIKSAIFKKTTDNISAIDLCCGEYSWLARHFDSQFNIIYCLDREILALESARNLSKKSRLLHGEASHTLHQVNNIDFLYCGFNFYKSFLPGLKNSLKKGGLFFIMKPYAGDDIFLRNLIEPNYINNRNKAVSYTHLTLPTTSRV